MLNKKIARGIVLLSVIGLSIPHIKSPGIEGLLCLVLLMLVLIKWEIEDWRGER